jgi:hypothetical protein
LSFKKQKVIINLIKNAFEVKLLYSTLEKIGCKN